MIAFDTATSGGSSTNFVHVCTGSDLLLLVGIQVLTGNTPTVTYTSIPMTQLASTASSVGYTLFTFYLINPSTGSNHIIISSGGGNEAAVAASYTGVKQTGFPDSFNSTVGGNGVNNFNASTTVVASDCWIVAMGMVICTSGTGTFTTDRTQRVINTTSSNAPQGKSAIHDSNGTVGTSTQTFAVSVTGGGTFNGNATVISLAPAGVVANSGNMLMVF